MSLTLDSLPGWAPCLATVVVALSLRLGIHLGRTPGGVDTWYYLVYVREFRRTRRFPVRLSNYILQEPEQTYPPLFPLFLSLFPTSFLERWFWLFAPAIDVAQLALLYLASLKITGSVTQATLASLIYAVTPQLIGENRNLNSRAFGALFNAAMMLALFRATVEAELRPGWLAVALLLAVAVLMAHKLTTQAFIFTCLVLTVALGDWRYIAFAGAAFVAAEVLSLGFYGKVLGAHFDILRYWSRNNSRLLAHQVLDSPVYGGTGEPAAGHYRPGLRGQIKLLIRLLGENPFVLPMIVAPVFNSAWAERMYWWSVAVLAWAFLTTFIPPLRMFGQGHLYMKLSAFPTAYTLALATGRGNDPAETFLPRVVLVAAFVLSLAAIGYLYRYHRSRSTEHTSELPPDLPRVADFLRTQYPSDLFCLPAMYADYLTYETDNPVYWGGHGTGFAMLEPFFPIVAKSVPELVAHSKRCLLMLDTEYLDPSQLDLERTGSLLYSVGKFRVYELHTVKQTLSEAADCRSVPPRSAVERG